MAVLWRVYNWVVIGCVALAGALIAAGILLVVADVTMRALGFQPFGFTVAFVEYILLYFVLLAAPYLVREKGHVTAEVLFSQLGPLARRICEKIVYTICILVSLVFAYEGGVLFAEAVRYGYVDERSIDLPYWSLYVLFPLCFTLIAVEFLRYLLGADSLYDRDENPETM